MSFLSNLLASFGGSKPTTANAAKERLQVVVSHQRRHRSSPDYLPMLEKDIMAAIAKYVTVDENMVDIKFHRSSGQSTLEVNVDLPDEAAKQRTAASKSAAAAAEAAAGNARDGRLELVNGKLVRKPAAVD